MMPSKKSDFDKPEFTKESFNEKKCDSRQTDICNNIGAKKCVIGVNDRAICEVGAAHEYHTNMLKKMSY
jgi:hypothetical protein